MWSNGGALAARQLNECRRAIQMPETNNTAAVEAGCRAGVDDPLLRFRCLPAHLHICMRVHHHPEPTHYVTWEAAGQLQLRSSNKALCLLHDTWVQGARNPAGVGGTNKRPSNAKTGPHKSAGNTKEFLACQAQRVPRCDPSWKVQEVCCRRRSRTPRCLHH